MTNQSNNIVAKASLNGRRQTRIASVVLVCSLALLLTACSGRRGNTVDDSAEYRTAQSLPPLKKPVIGAANPSVASSRNSSADAEGLNQPQPSVEAQPNTELPLEMASATQSESQINTASSSSSDTDIASAIVVDGNFAKLTVDSDFDAAWDYLTDKIAGSEVTVFTRNKSAGSFAIGCAEVGTQAIGDTRRGSRWLIFNRKQPRTSEYCTLKVDSRRGKTTVTVLDRDGDEARAQYTQPILERIIKP